MGKILQKIKVTEKTQDDRVSINYVGEFIALNLDLSLKELLELSPLQLPLESPDINIEFKAESDGMFLKVFTEISFGGKVYTRTVPEYLFKYIAHLISEYEEIKFPTIESIEDEVVKRQRERKGYLDNDLNQD